MTSADDAMTTSSHGKIELTYFIITPAQCKLAYVTINEVQRFSN